MKIPIADLGDRKVLFAMAAEAEYGPCLKARFTPLMIGIGPVEAAVKLAAALSELRHEGKLPDLVVSLGSAGSRTLEQTEVYQASSVSYRDMDASPLGFEKGVTPFLRLPAEIQLPMRIPGIPQARLSTGGGIVSGEAYGEIAADMVDMETYACLRACQHFGVGLVALRGISDGAQELRHVSDWTQYLHVIDEKLAAAVDRLTAAIVEGVIAP
ncbi:5'-methylthioadenosine/S-adenosylhomocysteine nucleosidase [Chelativorans sp. J32]|uniref:5'-methylthioadenosine/S-adenosylhomocysteine nucleosidase n=1 Tax=Chelativorans sp. J32 TaxID=935840 RepID=UPI000487AFB4|nr:5'-methylthioadenosine/S-adenosylhomocysteine nucleosidase [Chelativorans sp. J32]